MTYAVHQFTVYDDRLRPQDGASVEVRNEADNTLQPLFTDRAGTVPTTNPVPSDDDGFVRFYCAAGAYKITVTFGSGSRVLRHVAIGSAAELDADVINALVAVAGSIGLEIKAIHKYTANDTWVPHAETTLARIIAQGGGAGGGGVEASTGTNLSGAAPGGSAGAYQERWIPLTSPPSWNPAGETVTVGAAANGGAPGANNGSAGNPSSVGTLVVAPGGVGGAGVTATGTVQRFGTDTVGGGPPTGMGGVSLLDLAENGGNGRHGLGWGTTNLSHSGCGGDSKLGRGGRGVSENTAGVNGSGFGSGGGGGATANNSTDRAGGNGAAGVVIIIEYGPA